MQRYLFCFFILLSSCAYPMVKMKSFLGQRAAGSTLSSLFISRVAHVPQFLRRTNAPAMYDVSRKIFDPGQSMIGIAITVGAAATSYKKKEEQITTPTSLQELAPFISLRDQLSDQLKAPQSAHLISRGYPELAPTTFSGHFERYNSPEFLFKISHDKKFKDRLLKKIEEDYFTDIPYEEKKVLPRLQKSKNN